jgi:plastocyanin domain-containing protein
MDTSQIGVLMGGLLLIGFTLWFFFGPRASEKAGEVGGVQQIKVKVQGGYSPDRIEVRRGQPVRLLFRREESTACTEQVIFGDFGVSAMLPQGQEVPVEFTPDTVGEFTFHCGMNMVRGKLIVTA